ncbi:MAG TPA: lysylphosphatidylglycerol synthase transmembrane domain-containing protein [Candidatus Dormibacteraeota bacterium]
MERHPRSGAVLMFLRRHWLITLAAVSLTGLIVLVNPGRIVRLFLSANRTDLVYMAPCVVLIYLTKGIGWWTALRRVGLKITLRRALYVMFVGRTLIFVPTGDLMRIALLKEREQHGVNAGAVAGTIAFQELVYTGLIGLGVLPRIGDHPELIALVVAMLLAHAGIFGILLWKRLYEWAVGIVEKVRVFRRFDEQLRSLRPAFIQMTTPRVVILVILWNSCAVFFLMTLFYLAVVAVAGPHVGLGQTTFAYGLGHILGGLSLLPSGMGAMEAIVAGLLVTQGVPFYAGVAAVILFRAYNDIFSALVGALVGVLGGRFRGPLRRVQTFSKS